MCHSEKDICNHWPWKRVICIKGSRSIWVPIKLLRKSKPCLIALCLTWYNRSSNWISIKKNDVHVAVCFNNFTLDSSPTVHKFSCYQLHITIKLKFRMQIMCFLSILNSGFCGISVWTWKIDSAPHTVQPRGCTDSKHAWKSVCNTLLSLPWYAVSIIWPR